MIKLKKLLLETHLRDLYHATYIAAVGSMLEDNSIGLTFVGGTEADQQLNKRYNFFLSTMRQKYGNYARIRGTSKIHYPVIIHLNGQKLVAAGFKIFPVDFYTWGKEWSEQEERIVSNKDAITPLDSFVEDIHIYIGSTPTEILKSTLFEIDKLAEKYSFPIYFYTVGAESYFKMHNPTRATTDITSILPPPELSPDDLEHIEKYGKKRYVSRGAVENIQALINIYNGNPIDKNDKVGKRMVDRLMYHPYDAYPVLSADIHNLRDKHPPIFRELVKIIKREGLTTVKELVDLLINRARKEWEIKQQQQQYQADQEFLKNNPQYNPK